MANWQPSDFDLEWTRNLIALIKEGGTWGIPGSRSTFTFYHSRKSYKFEGDREHELNRKTFDVLDRLGWKEDHD